MKPWLALVLVCASCATTGAPAERVRVRVSNLNWYTSRVILTCETGRTIVMRNWAVGEVRTRNYRVNGCHGFYVTIVGDGRRVYPVQYLTRFQPGETVCIKIDPVPYMTSYVWNCTVRT